MTRARIDANQPEIVDTLRALGASVQSLASVGDGCPDLVVGWRGRNVLLEIKDGAKAPSRRRLTADERRWHASWSGEVVIVATVEQATAAVFVQGEL